MSGIPVMNGGSKERLYTITGLRMYEGACTGTGLKMVEGTVTVTYTIPTERGE